MRNALPPLGWFRAFEASARHLSFTAAADELNVTQSAISQHVRSLETRLSVQLFIRRARGLTLTDDGRKLLPYVTGAIGELEDGTAIVSQVGGEEELKIMASVSFGQFILAPRLSSFVNDNPGTRIRLLGSVWADQHISSEADLQIRFCGSQMAGKDAVRLAHDDVLPVCAPGYFDLCRSPEEILRYPLIQAVGTSDTWTSWCGHAGIATPEKLDVRVDNYSLVIAAALGGLGVALASRFLSEDLVTSGQLVVPVDKRCPAKDSFYLSRRDTRTGTAADRFVTWLMDETAAARG